MLISSYFKANELKFQKSSKHHQPIRSSQTYTFISCLQKNIPKSLYPNPNNLFSICCQGKLDFFVFELAKFQNPVQALQTVNKDGNTCLMLAIIFDYLDIVTYILETYKVNIHLVNHNGDDILSLSIKYQRVYIFEYLLKFGFDINQKNLLGESPLHIAIKYNNLSIIQLLLLCDANIDELNEKGQSALILSILYNNDFITLFLIGNEANLDLFDNFSQNALYYAIIYDKINILLYLVENDVNLDVRYVNNNTALIVAVLNQSVNCIRFLLEYDKLAKSKINDNGENALYIAMKYNYENILQIFNSIK